MSTIYNHIPPLPEKPTKKHPWEARIKNENVGVMKYVHNSTTSNLRYPKDVKYKKAETTANDNKKYKPKSKDKFTIIGIKLTKEFIYCRQWVTSLHKYRQKLYEAPIITGLTTVEWPKVSEDLKRDHKMGYCIESPVMVLLNDQYLGGHEQLKEYLEQKFTYHIVLDYEKESIKEFAYMLNSTSRPYVYMHFSVNGEAIGTMIFMLYVDIVPLTCANFIRLCQETRGGYAGTPVHRIVKDCWIQCGGFGLKSTDMRCENFALDFDKRGVLGMANADRHVDCSTQFFIISQPAPWMNEHYVAFGQLIDGEATFKKIEEIPTHYESPMQDIRIFKAGVINLECMFPFPINKSTREYINAHIENLFEVGEFITNLLWESVSEGILLNYLRSLEGAEEMVGEELEKIKPVNRFVHTKPPSGVDEDDEENNDFDVDSYHYEPEEYAYSHVSGTLSPVIKPDIPHYIQLTDVPYPDEVDSNFDLKRFIKGYYCLETDVRPRVPRRYLHSTQELDKSLSSFISDDSPESSTDSEVEAEFKEELWKTGEKVSMAGPTIKKIAKSLAVQNLMKYFYSTKGHTAFNDEELRKARLTATNIKISKQRHLSKRAVSLTVCEDHVDRKVKRRPTGFLRDEDVIRMVKARIKAGIEIKDDDSYSDEDYYYEPQHSLDRKATKSVAIDKKNVAKDDKPPESALHRLYSDVAIYEGEQPTLKDYRSVTSSLRNLKTRSLFLTESQKVQVSADSFDDVKSLHVEKYHISQHTKFETKDDDAIQVESVSYHDLKPSIKSRQFQRVRPSMTKEQYQERNKLQQTSKLELEKSKRTIGLRLPGDSPLYYSDGSSSASEIFPKKD